MRCHQTIEPLAEELGAPIHNEPLLTEEAYADDRKSARRRILEIAAARGTPVICTQGKVIPDLIAWWCERDGVRPDKSRNRKGSTWVHVVIAGPIGGRRPHQQSAGRQEIAAHDARQIRRGS